MVVIYEKDWKHVTLDGKPAVRVNCPRCQQSFLLDHTIDMVGNISPSLDCPNEQCSFHDGAVLDNFIDYGKHGAFKTTVTP